MNEKRETYWQEFRPLWWDEIKSWFGWTDLMSTILKSGSQTLALFIVFLLGGSAENFFEAAAVQLVTYILVFISLEVILFITYIRASRKLYQNQRNILDRLQTKLESAENSKPIIQAKNPKVERKGLVNNEWRDAVSIDVLNIAPGTTAEKVFPTVTWFTMRGKFVTENQGRWWISTEDAAVTKTADRQVMDLLSNGKAYLFHFAVQSHDNQFFYAWFRANNGADKRSNLYEKKYEVKIHFRSNNNAEANFTYIVENNGGKLAIREVRKKKPSQTRTP